MILTNSNNAQALTHSCDNITSLLVKYKQFTGNDSIQEAALISFLLVPSSERAEFYHFCDNEVSMVSSRAVIQKIS